MVSSRQGVIILSFLVLLIFGQTVTSWALDDIPGKVTSIYSPIIQIVPDHDGKGFLRVSTQGGVLWVEASKAAKPHLPELPIGGLIDVTIMFRGKPTPPLIQSWKLASGESTCPVFNGERCVPPDEGK